MIKNLLTARGLGDGLAFGGGCDHEGVPEDGVEYIIGTLGELAEEVAIAPTEGMFDGRHIDGVETRSDRGSSRWRSLQMRSF